MNQKILVADDSIASQRLFEMVLTREGYEVITIGSGTQVLDAVRDKRPDIALIDAIMPEVDGYQICKMLKENAEFRHLPVIMLAGRYEDFDREKGMNVVGTEAILNKPSKSEDIVAKVKEFLTEPSEEIEEIEEIAEGEERAAPIAEVIEEPSFVQEEYEFDEDSEEADLVVENELLEEEAEVVDMGELEEGESQEDEEGFAIDETEELVEERWTVTEEERLVEKPVAPAVESPVLTEKPVVQEAPSLSPEISPAAEIGQISDEKLDLIAEDIAQRLAQKLVPVLMQQLAAYVMHVPVVKSIVEQTSMQLVKELLPEIQKKK